MMSAAAVLDALRALSVHIPDDGSPSRSCISAAHISACKDASTSDKVGEEIWNAVDRVGLSFVNIKRCSLLLLHLTGTYSTRQNRIAQILSTLLSELNMYRNLGCTSMRSMEGDNSH